MIDHELEAQGLRLVTEHINRVQHHISSVVGYLIKRSVEHDQSKYSPEEIGLVLGKPSFDKYEYMSKEERAALEDVKGALVHHYAENSHHPEHHESGVDNMSLLDLLEMLCDWKAASEMSAKGNFKESVSYGIGRFSISPQLANILLNTGKEMGWLD